MLQRQQINRRHVSLATISRLFLAALAIFGCTNTPAVAQSPAYRLPHFRDASEASPAPAVAATQVFQLLGDQDFPPFSFASQQGPSGLAVEMALAACAEAKVQCQVSLLPFKDLLQALAERRGDVVISGLRIDEQTLKSADATRPYFRTLGRFVVQSGNPLAKASAATLAGKRIGVVKGTAHEAWLKSYFASATVEAFGTVAEAQGALRTGNVDAVFGDNLQMIYWTAGEASGKCCKLLDGAFSDLDYFSRNIAFFVRKDLPELRAALDYGLDQMQINGTTDTVFNRYVPLPPW